MNDSRTPASPSFLTDPNKCHWINGVWRASSSGERIESLNPATGGVLATLARGRVEDVDAAVAAARHALDGPWSRFTPHQRQMTLMRMHDLVDRHFDELSLLESLDMGAPLSRTRNLKPFVLQLIAHFAAQAANCNGQTIANSLPGNFTTLTVKAPVGVVGGIIPWNGPIMGQWWVLGGALATGCTAVLKPAEDASLSVLRTAELLAEAGVPNGVVNVVTGLGAEAGAALAGHPQVDRIVFTGSTATGREIIKASAVNIKRLQLELGGKSPDIVFADADADLDKAVPGAAMAGYTNSGQACYAGTRLFVQRSIQEEFVERLVSFSKTLRVEDALGIAQTCVNSTLSLRKAGRHLQIGLTTKQEAGYIRLPVDLIVVKELKIIGSLGMAPHRYESMVPLVSQNKLTPGRMITREISLSEVEGIFEDMTRSAVTGTFVVTQFRKGQSEKTNAERERLALI